MLKWLAILIGNYYQKRDDNALDLFFNNIKINNIEVNSSEYKKLYRNLLNYLNYGLTDDEMCDINIKVEQYASYKIEKSNQDLANWWRQSYFTYLIIKKKFIFRS